MRNSVGSAWGFVLAAGLLLSGDLDAGSLEPPGPPAPTMKTIEQSEPRIPISSLPITISAPGSYYLTDDLTGVSGQHGITVSSAFVTIDLNGFALIGVAGSLNGIMAQVAPNEQLEIRNGVIRNWGSRGILATGSGIHAMDLRVTGNGSDGLSLGARAVVRDTTAIGNGASGIAVGTGSTIIGCTATNNSSSGIVPGTFSLVSSSIGSSNAVNGFLLSTASVATDCIAENSPTGFNLGTASRASRSVARGNNVGFSGGSGVSVEDCVADTNFDDGIRLTSLGLARGNVARANTNAGIHATGTGNRIEGNSSNANAVGIRVDGTSSLVVRNSTSGNNLEYQVAGGNEFAAVSTNPDTAGPWANFDH